MTELAAGQIETSSTGSLTVSLPLDRGGNYVVALNRRHGGTPVSVLDAVLRTSSGGLRPRLNPCVRASALGLR
jgi:hypothetical protein